MADERVLADAVAQSHLLVPDDLPLLLLEHGKRLGALDSTLYLTDYEERHLVAVPRPGVSASTGDLLGIDGTVAGRAYRQMSVQRVGGPGEGDRLWVPLVDGVQRLGVMEIVFPDAVTAGVEAEVVALASLLAELVMVKGSYGDLLEKVRRREPMSLGAELVWQLLPPLTFATDRLVISGALVPAYDLGGDSFDYGVDHATARFAIFDAMGHGLPAGILTSVALAAYRSARRRDLELAATAEEIDGALATAFGDGRFVTAVVAELELATGVLRWHIAGHPRPLVLRNGKIVKVLEGEPGLPFGLGGPARAVAEETLEPGDQLVLFTDGVVEARASNGEFFGEDRLVDFIVKVSAAGAPAPETMRQLVHAIVDHHDGALDDDATAVFVEWRGHGPERLEP